MTVNYHIPAPLILSIIRNQSSDYQQSIVSVKHKYFLSALVFYPTFLKKGLQRSKQPLFSRFPNKLKLTFGYHEQLGQFLKYVVFLQFALRYSEV